MQPTESELISRPPRLGLAETTVQLRSDELGDALEADAINVGPGGLALRSPLLPELGSQLECCFAHPETGAPIRAKCEVVWVADQGPNLGEFGLRFEQLDAESIEPLMELLRSGDRVLTPREAEDLGWHPAPAAEPLTVALALDGVASELIAEVVHDGDDLLVGEQELPFLRLGTGVTTEDGRTGVLTSVELKVVDHLPRLVLTVSYDEPTSAPAAYESESDAVHDADDDSSIEASLAALAEADEDFDADDADDTLPDDVPSPVAKPRAYVVEARPATSRSDVPAPEARGPEGREPSRLRELGEPMLDRASGVAHAVRDAAEVGLGAAVPAVRKGLEKMRDGAARSASMLPEVGTAAVSSAQRIRRFATLFADKLRSAPEKTTEAPRRRVQGQRASMPAVEAAEAPARKLRGRHVLVGLLGLVVVGLSIRGVTNAADETPPPALPVVAEAPPPPVVEAPAPAAVVPVAAAPAAAPLPTAAVVPAPTQALPVDVPATGPDVAPTSPTQLDPLDAPPSPTRHFGAATVPAAMRFELTMTTPIERIAGETTEHGIVVHVLRSNSISRAGPIASQHPAVERASIHNLGENAELRLEWKPGQHPRYRVEAAGNRLIILIAR